MSDQTNDPSKAPSVGESVVDQLVTYRQELAATRAELDALRAEQARAKITEAVRAEAEARGVRAEALPDVLAMVGPQLALYEGGIVAVRDKPHVSVGMALEEYVERRPYLRDDQRRAPTPATFAPPTPGAKYDLSTSEGATAAMRARIAEMLQRSGR